jgi:hypothetical protein
MANAAQTPSLLGALHGHRRLHSLPFLTAWGMPNEMPHIAKCISALTEGRPWTEDDAILEGVGGRRWPGGPIGESIWRCLGGAGSLCGFVAGGLVDEGGEIRYGQRASKGSATFSVGKMAAAGILVQMPSAAVLLPSSEELCRLHTFKVRGHQRFRLRLHRP